MNTLQRLMPWNWGVRQLSESDLKIAIYEEARRTRDAELAENLAHAELELEDAEWVKLSSEGRHTFSRGGLRRIIELSRTMFLLNPLVKQGVNLQARYVFGQGVRITAKDDQVNAVVQDFLKRNARILTGHSKMVGAERTLQLTGNILITFFFDRISGVTSIRTIPVDQVPEIVTDPEDRQTPWFYRRVWWVKELGEEEGQGQMRELLYPDIDYTPTNRPAELNGIEIRWDTPVQHISAGGLEDQLFGIPEPNAALRWALAYTQHLNDWASVVRSLRIFAWKGKSDGSPKALANRMRSSIAKGDSSRAESNPAPAKGGIFASTRGMDLSPMKTAGMPVGPQDGRMLRQMVAANFGASDPHISMDVQQGALATAKDLNQPMFLKYRERQELWQEELLRMLEWAVAMSTQADGSPIRGKGQVETLGNRRVIVINEEIDTTIDINFPPIVEGALVELIDAIVKAATLDGKALVDGLLDIGTVQRLVLSALAERNIVVDESEINATVQATAEEAFRRAKQLAGVEATG